MQFRPKIGPLKLCFETPQTCRYRFLGYVYQTAKLYCKNSGLQVEKTDTVY